MALAFVTLASQAWATVHYVNKGTRYHLGDDVLETTRDKNIVATHPNIGTTWEQDFEASRNDTVEVLIEQLWGVDARDDRHIDVYIDGEQIGEINAGETGPWQGLFKADVRKGRLHTLKIHTYGKPDPDDFVFEGVQVRTYTGARIDPVGVARVFGAVKTKSLNPGENKLPLAGAELARPVSTVAQNEGIGELLPGKSGSYRIPICGIFTGKDAKKLQWRPDNPGKGDLLLSVGHDRVVKSDVLAKVPQSQLYTFFFKVRDLPHGPAGQHVMRIFGDRARSQAWFFSLEAVDTVRAKNGAHGLAASHKLGSFDEEGLLLLPGWNKVVLKYCYKEGAYLEINDRVLGTRHFLTDKNAWLTIDVLGIELELSENGG